jgi:phosphoglycolate phosphatase
MVGKGIANLVNKALNAALGHEAVARTGGASVARFRRSATRNCSARGGPVRRRDCRTRLHACAGLALACITNKSTRFTLPLLERTGLAHRFGHVVCGDTYERRKPDPLPLLKTAERFNCAPHELLMIGDSANDVTAARAAGCPILCVPYGYNEGEPVDKLDFDGMIHDLSEACAWIEKHAATNASGQ